MTAPGLYQQPLAQLRASGRLSRGDVPVFLGYARRGPAYAPVRIESLTMFEEVFGPPLEAGYLYSALKGFFENGGRATYVIRLVPEAARAAQVRLAAEQDPAAQLGSHWLAQASFAWSLIDPRERRREARPDEATWVQLIEQVFRTVGPRSPAPGAWGNTYQVQVSRNGQLRTETIPAALDNPAALWLKSLAGVEAHSILTLTQSGRGFTHEATVIVSAIDTARQQVLLSVPLSELGGFVEAQPIQVSSVEFDIEIWVAGRLEQAFRQLSPHPAHSASIIKVMSKFSRSISLQPMLLEAEPDWSEQSNWPAEGTFALTGGNDALELIAVEHYLAGLERVVELDEVALLAAPDLVLQPQDTQRSDILSRAPVDCCDLSPVELGVLVAQVFDEQAEQARPLAGVEVMVLGQAGYGQTDINGQFKVSGVPLGLNTIRLIKEGYAPIEVVLVAESYLPSELTVLHMTRIAVPRALAADDVLTVLQAMLDPARVGPYKIAVVDPLSPTATLDELRAWRARLGDSNRMAFFAPWLRLPSTNTEGQGGTIPCPPSGHMCGVFAAAEQEAGIHRSGANLPIRYVEGVMLEIDEQSHGLLNPDGINVIRGFPGRGVRLYGTRTLSSDPQWRYLTARRVVDAIEKTLERGLHWMVFEPNNLMTRHAVTQSASVLLNRLWREGVLAGSSPAGAYSVKCDLENNPNESREVGQLVVDISVAPSAPFEFIYFRLGNVYEAVKMTEER